MLLFVGRIEPLKGVDTLIRALALLRESGVQCHAPHYLAIIGGDPLAGGENLTGEMARLQALCRELGLDDLVLFLGMRGCDWETMLPETMGGHACMTPDLSEPLPFFANISREVQALQRGIATLTFAAKPYRSRIAILWAPYNHYISRLYPFQENGFTGTWLYNIMAGGGALLRGIDRLVAEETGLPVHIADDPLTAVAEGTGRVLQELQFLKRVAYSSRP